MVASFRLLLLLCELFLVLSFRRAAPSMAREGHMDPPINAQGAFATVPAMLVLANSAPAVALSSAEENRIRTGYKNLNYLLENWDKETTKCNAAGGCVRTPDNIRYYLGMRSTDDPLFQVEKLFLRAGAEIDGEDGERFEDALNEWSRHVEQANIMAYTSSWGEANPGGGQDRINQFAKKAFNEVQLARDALGTMVDVLKVKL